MARFVQKIFSIFRSLLGDDLINWNCLRLSIPTSVCPQKSLSDFNLIWCVGRPQSVKCISTTSTRSKVKIKVTKLLKFWKLHFSRSISSTIFAWSSKLMVDYDTKGPRLQLVRAWFLNSLLSKVSRDFKLRKQWILQDFQRAIFPYCLRLESHGQVSWKSHMYCACWYDLDTIQGQVQGHGAAMTVSPLPGPF